LGKGNSSLFNRGLGLLQRGDNHKNVKIGLGHLKIFSRTTGPEKLKFIWKLSDIVQNKFVKIMALGGQVGP
jgi:hypothetical protein